MLIEICGFALLISIVFLAEFLPLWFGENPGYRPNYVEALIEAGIGVLICLVIMAFSRRLIRRLVYLEGFLPVCSFCKNIKVDEEWVPIEEYVSSHSGAIFSHSFCPDCAKKHYGEFSQDIYQPDDDGS